MKPLLTLIAVFFIAQAFAQNSKADSDTLLLKNGTYYYGTFVNESVEYYHFKHLDEKKLTSYRKDEVLRIGKWSTDSINSVSVLKQSIPPDTISLQRLYEEFKKLKASEEESGWYMKKAGGWGIASGVLIVGGSIMSIVGAVKGNQTLSIVGGSISGAGVVFSIPAFANLHRAGKGKLKDTQIAVQEF